MFNYRNCVIPFPMFNVGYKFAKYLNHSWALHVDGNFLSNPNNITTHNIYELVPDDICMTYYDKYCFSVTGDKAVLEVYKNNHLSLFLKSENTYRNLAVEMYLLENKIHNTTSLHIYNIDLNPDGLEYQYTKDDIKYLTEICDAIGCDGVDILKNLVLPLNQWLDNPRETNV